MENKHTLARAPATTLKVLILLQETLYADCLALALEQFPRLRAVRAACDSEAVYALFLHHRPDVILTSASYLDAAEAAVPKSCPEAQILTVPNGRPGPLSSAHSRVSETLSVRELYELLTLLTSRLRRGDAREASFPITAACSLREAVTKSLTRREHEIFLLVAKGMSNLLISQTLHISLHTAKNHVHNVMTKLGAKSRGEAVAFLRASFSSLGNNPTS